MLAVLPFQVALLGGAPFTPRDLGTDLIAWWDADPSTWGSKGGITTATGVSSWRDNVASYDATQGTGSAQPLWSATSFGGAPGIAFDGIDDTLACTNATLLAAIPASGPFEMWALGSQDALPADTSTRRIMEMGSGISTVVTGITRVVTLSVNRGRGITGNGSTSIATSDTAVDLSTRHVIRHEVGTASAAITVDNATPVSAAVTPALNKTRIRIGSGSAASPSGFWQGQAATVLITAPLSTGKAAILQTYLLNRRRL